MSNKELLQAIDKQQVEVSCAQAVALCMNDCSSEETHLVSMKENQKKYEHAKEYMEALLTEAQERVDRKKKEELGRLDAEQRLNQTKG